MRPAQEVANAVTMLPIAILALGVLRDPARSSGAHLVAVSVLVHNPFSLLYHVSCAVNFEKCHPIENNPFLKLDLSFIHIGGMIMSFATSGSLVYFAGSVVFNSICIYRTVTWCGTTFQRRLGRVFCFLNYSAPVALTDAGLFALLLGIFAFIAGTFVFSRQLGGWGHALSHLLLFPFTQCLIWAAGQITAIA